ncbi:lipoprotein [Rhizobium sp. ARZ01]|uniref:LPS translocon maturation chaperone LptM n=1 Tax=Rhizobium sp. ARZ01 TaxID=2769313 RepID=UPI001782CE32|nr:lipoprotein [Rhizobium sp. ARZ01]MBD9374924.1 lipoprotein [Rhizobium sp. ARZ01]
MTLKTTARLALVLVLSATVIAACGRKGDLDPPGAAPASKASAGKDTKKQVVEDKPFILDALL